MDRTLDRRTVTMIIAAVLIGALISGLAVWAAMNGRLSDAEERAELAEDRVSEVESEVEILTTLLEAGEDTEGDAGDEESVLDAEGASSSKDDTTGVAEEAGRFFCFMTSARWEGDQPELTVDYAQMLTGAEAAAAATAAGDESPPPNDYYIVNQNPKLRTFPADAGMTVRMTSTAEGTQPEGYDMPFGQWYDAFSGMSGSFPAIRDVPYWITIENGTIVMIEEQYLP
jgi:hypothetical protein